MDRVMEESKDSTTNRYKYDRLDNQGEIIDGERLRKKIKKENPYLIRPDNVFRFPTAGGSRDNLIRHPAPYNKELPLYFINLLTDEDDLVIDPFSGIGTTGVACKEINRSYIGYELNNDYVKYSIDRLNDNINQTYIIEKYDLEGNLLKIYDNIYDVVKDIPGARLHDILRIISRNTLKSHLGYKFIKKIIEK